MICTSCYLYGGTDIPNILNNNLLYGPVTDFTDNPFTKLTTLAEASVYKPSDSKI